MIFYFRDFNQKIKGIALLPVILAVIFISLLGGVGLGILNTKNEISKSVVEIQKLEEEGKYDQALEKLKTLENNFFIRYFGFKKEEIENKISEIAKIVEQSKESEIKEGEEIKKEAEKENISENNFFDCGDNLDCFIDYAKICSPTKIKSDVPLRLGKYYLLISFYGEIRGKEKDKCVFYIRAEKILDFQKEGEEPEKLEKEKSALKLFLEGKEEVCFFKNEDLTKWLEEVSREVLPFFEDAECKYKSLDLLKKIKE